MSAGHCYLSSGVQTAIRNGTVYAEVFDGYPEHRRRIRVDWSGVRFDFKERTQDKLPISDMALVKMSDLLKDSIPVPVALNDRDPDSEFIQAGFGYSENPAEKDVRVSKIQNETSIWDRWTDQKVIAGHPAIDKDKGRILGFQCFGDSAGAPN